ncbi:Bax inhibitor-1/YccA family protein [Candidatus Peregrinibacteria bacterium]|nr:Bax inhibitor-1/YccA family protein [Candidatus Peregrinibacteria bacterium]
MDPRTEALSPDLVISKFFANVYKWMTIALAITAFVAWKIASTEAFFTYLLAHQGMLIALIIAQFAAVIALAGWAHRMSFGVALFIFLLYSALTGITFSSIFIVYSAAMISKAFVVTAGMYGATALYGYTTKRDISAWRGFLFMSLIGIIIASVANFWMHSDYIDWMITYGGIIVFAGLTAYDHQKLKQFALMDVNGASNLAIRGALTLYLDFINLFLLILRAMNRR